MAGNPHDSNTWFVVFTTGIKSSTSVPDQSRMTLRMITPPA
jgi:hypothetical protein